MTGAAEIWRVVPRHPGYEVSTLGRVRSLPRSFTDRLGRTRVVPGQILKPQARDAYYLSVSLGKRRSARIHDLVAEAFLGPRPKGFLVLHRDDDGHHNELTNLRYGSHAANRADVRRNLAQGEPARVDGVLTPFTAACVKALLPHHTQRELARAFGASRGAICGIKRRRNWHDLSPCPLDVAQRELDRRRNLAS